MPAPEVSLPQAVENYVRNRANFYEALFRRIPEPGMVERLQPLADPLVPTADLLDQIRSLPAQVESDLLDALKLRDLLKKSGSGSALGKTAISVDDALARAEHVEETGVLLFWSLSEFNFEFASELDKRKHALAQVLHLTDDLRYHRIRFTKPAE